MVLATAAITTPKEAKPIAVTKPMKGTSSMPMAGDRPKAMATSSGATQYTPARSEIHSTSAVMSSSTSIGVASMASYERWKRQRMNVLNMPGKADENRTAVATT